MYEMDDTFNSENDANIVYVPPDITVLSTILANRWRLSRWSTRV